MKRTILALAMVISATIGAGAADIPAAPRVAPPVMPVVPVGYDWSGFYIGANGGYGWGEAVLQGAGVTVSLLDDLKGPVAGGQVGYNWQTGQFVLGIELDGQWANIETKAFGATFSIDWFATARLRAGVAINNVLLYGTGGYMHGGTSVSGFGVSVDGDRGGWTAGGGVEFGFTPNWSIKAEYLFLRSFDESLGFGVDGHVEAHIARAGINYRFGAPTPVVARY